MKENKREATFICGGCLEEIPLDQLYEFDGRNLCHRCLEEETALCSVCGERIWNYDNAGTSETPLCQRCYDNYYTSCDRCGALIRLEEARYAPDDEDEDYPLCGRCYNTFNWTLDLSSHEAGARHLQPSEIALLQYREHQSGNMDTILDRHITDPQPLFTITITKEEAQAYCRSIGMKFFGKKWQDKTVIISI